MKTFLGRCQAAVGGFGGVKSCAQVLFSPGFFPPQHDHPLRLARRKSCQHVRKFHQYPGGQGIAPVFGENKIVGQINAHVASVPGGSDERDEIAIGGLALDWRVIGLQYRSNNVRIQKAFIRLLVEKIHGGPKAILFAG
jgi:hypothetical protein